MSKYEERNKSTKIYADETTRRVFTVKSESKYESRFGGNDWHEDSDVDEYSATLFEGDNFSHIVVDGTELYIHSYEELAAYISLLLKIKAAGVLK